MNQDDYGTGYAAGKGEGGMSSDVEGAQETNQKGREGMSSDVEGAQETNQKGREGMSSEQEPNRAAKGVPMKVLWSLTLGIVLTALVVGCATVEQSDTPAASVATVIPTLTAEESLQQFVLCDRLVAKKSMFWGQAPGVIYSGNPQITGMIKPGDYVRFLTPPTADGVIRIKVFPHDDRVVGKSNNQVWISWVELTRYRLDREMFTCED